MKTRLSKEASSISIQKLFVDKQQQPTIQVDGQVSSF